MYTELDQLELCLQQGHDINSNSSRSFTFLKPQFLADYWKQKANQRQIELLSTDDSGQEDFLSTEQDSTDSGEDLKGSFTVQQNYERTPSVVPGDEQIKKEVKQNGEEDNKQKEEEEVSTTIQDEEKEISTPRRDQNKRLSQIRSNLRHSSTGQLDAIAQNQ